MTATLEAVPISEGPTHSKSVSYRGAAAPANVFENGNHVGDSTSNPCCSYGLEAGTESSDNSNSESGEDTNLQIEKTNGGSFTDGWPPGVTSGETTGPGMSFSWVNIDHSFTTRETPGPIGNGPGGAASTTVATPTPKVGTRAATRDASATLSTAELAAVKKNANTIASADGEYAPTHIQVALTTRRVAAQVDSGGWVNTNQPVFFVVLHGNFTDYSASVPFGSPQPTGTVLTLTIDAVTNQLTRLSIRNVTPNLSRLRIVKTLSLSSNIR